MSRDPGKLKVFKLADELVLDVYRLTKALPSEERFGLQSQIRRSAVSVPTNIVEGCGRSTTRDYLHFVTLALSSTAEVRYLIGLARRLEFLPPAAAESIESRYDDLGRGLNRLTTALQTEPKA